MTSFPKSIQITEVGPRDGLQNQSKQISTAKKIELIDALSKTGLKTIEVTAFVHPTWVPQHADADEVLAGIHRKNGVKYTAVVPNERGWDRARLSGVDEIAVLSGATETFCQRNTNTTIQGALDRIRPIVEQALECGVPVRGYISCVIACPYEGETDLQVVRSISEQMLDMGISTIALGETIGVAVPSDIRKLYDVLDGVVSPEDTVIHLHDTHGHALACAQEAMHCGVIKFDASCGGLGGCPYAPGSAGNLGTEDLVSFAQENEIETGVDLNALVRASRLIEMELDCSLQSKVYRTLQSAQARPSE